MAIEENIKIAYSNECFELWLLLHFKQINESNPLQRTEIYKQIEDFIKNNIDINFVYNHGDKSIVDIIEKYGNKDEAISRAQNLDNYHISNNNKPIESNPNTLVYKLVKELDDWYSYYSFKG